MRAIVALIVVALLLVVCAGVAVAGSKPGIFAHQLDRFASVETGMFCMSTVDVWRPRLIVATVVCRAVKTETG